MKPKGSVYKDDGGHPEILITINNKEIGVLLSSIRWYLQQHKEHPDDLTFKQLWDVEVDLRDTLDLLRD